MHAFSLFHRKAPKPAATALPALRRAALGGTAAAGIRGPQCTRRWIVPLVRSSVPFARQQHVFQQQKKQHHKQLPHQFAQVKCLHGTPEDVIQTASTESSERVEHPTAENDIRQHNEHSVGDAYSRERCTCSSNGPDGTKDAAYGNENHLQTAENLPSDIPSQASDAVCCVYGRRKRYVRARVNAGEARNTTSTCSATGKDDRLQLEQQNNVVIGRRRGRAARSCFEATAAWLGAVLPQAASIDPPGGSAAAAFAMRTQGDRMIRFGINPATSAASFPTQKKLGLPELETSDATAAVDEGAANCATKDNAAEAVSDSKQESASRGIGRRRRQGSLLGLIGSPGSPDVTWGGAINFQFPILFNVAIKRLLKPLFHRARQQRSKECSRATPEATPAAASGAVGGPRTGPRPRLPPRILLRSWRPLSKAQSVVNHRQFAHARQQQLQALRKQLLSGSSVISQDLQGDAVQQQLKQQHQQQLTAAQELETVRIHDQAIDPASKVPEEETLRTASDVDETVANFAANSDGFQSKTTMQDEETQALATPSGSDSTASNVRECQEDTQERVQQKAQDQLHEKSQEQMPQEVKAKPASAASAAPLRVPVGRASSRTSSARRPPSICFLRQRMRAMYRQLRSLLAPYCASISEWMYRNGNVVVTAGSLLSLTATLMADMRLLRTFNLLAGLCYFSYNWSRRPRLTDAALWNVVFLVLNTVMLWRVHTEHREVSFNSDELDLFQRYFLPAGMSPRQFRRLLRLGAWQTYPQGYVLQQENSNCETLCFVARGAVEISQGGETVDTYRGGDTGAVLGVEPFLSYLAALRKQSAKRVSHTAATPPETLASHADEPPDSLQEKGPALSVESGTQQVVHTGASQQQPQQNRMSEGGDLVRKNVAMGAYGRDAPSEEETAKLAAQDADSTRGRRQRPHQKLLQSTLEVQSARAHTEPAPVGTAVSKSSVDAAEGATPGTGIVAAAAEAAATAAAAVRTAAATALSAESPQTLETRSPSRGEMKTSTAAAVVKGGVSAAAEGARQVAEAAAAAAAAAVAAATDVASADASDGKQMGFERRLQKQLPLHEVSAPPKEDSDDFESVREEGVVTAPSTATCITETTVFCLDLEQLAAFVLREPENLGFPVVQGLTTLLVNRSRAQAARLALFSYDAFLAGVFADGVVQTGERKMLEEFRRKRAISQAQHEQALARLGWTPEEFERGSQATTGILSRMAFGLGAFLRGSTNSDSTADTELQQPHQGTISDQQQDRGASSRARPCVLDDWVEADGEGATSRHPQTAKSSRGATYPAGYAGASTAKDRWGDAVSYAFEAEAASSS
ncbi:hypothetical protein, conserved [Eimeria necatrix]|uniref:POPDC1-3 domain-containing protein n=1 Tax=Eimeria necatrix TaxID=51315 RepID=U6MHY2_9EIME|nr:hypothetical protein, conserved [Eimeria necatrix]CDJ63872.1 hypothetical protein, conserved [Eimeria necatrix]